MEELGSAVEPAAWAKFGLRRWQHLPQLSVFQQSVLAAMGASRDVDWRSALGRLQDLDAVAACFASDPKAR